MQNSQIISEAIYTAFSLIPVEARTSEIQEQIEAYEARHNLNVDKEETALQPTVDAPKSNGVSFKDVSVENPSSTFQDVSKAQSEQSEGSEINEQLKAVMTLKGNVRSQVLPGFKDKEVADFQLVASVAESFAEDRIHTLAYEVTEGLRSQFNKTNAYLSFRPIITTELSSREVKTEQAKKNWATVCTEYTTESTGKFRNTVADKSLKIGSQLVTYSDVIKYTHNPENLLGYVKVEFDTDFLDGLKNELDAWLDIDIDEARMQQKRWYVKHKDIILSMLDGMNQYKPTRLTQAKFERYKLLLAIAHIWGQEHFNNVLAIVNNLALTSGVEEHVKFAIGLREALNNAQALFANPLTEMASDTLIAELNKLGSFNFSRQTLPGALKELGVNTDTERRPINFFGNTVQGYDVATLEAAVAPFCKDEGESKVA